LNYSKIAEKISENVAKMYYSHTFMWQTSDCQLVITSLLAYGC